jgi:hypothetical protein
MPDMDGVVLRSQGDEERGDGGGNDKVGGGTLDGSPADTGFGTFDGSLVVDMGSAA